MKRRAGILLHPTCLPSPFGIGDFGFEAFWFVDFLKKSGQTIWEVLPLKMPDSTGSPYASHSSLAGNYMLISPDQLVKTKLLPKNNLPRQQPVTKVNYHTIAKQRQQLIADSFNYFNQGDNSAQRKKFANFIKCESAWLNDYALFMAIRNHFHGLPWYNWPNKIANRQKSALKKWQKKLADKIQLYQYEQWLFLSQWLNLKKYANKQGVLIFGDLPFFVSYDSVDVWTNRKLFLLNKKNRPITVSGAPPDYFSKTGQLWDDPHYNWPAMKKIGFNWWLQRFAMALRMYDWIRLDHFRGYKALWHIPYRSQEPKKGRWVTVPGQELFQAVKKKLPRLPAIAEDLGTITKDVVKLRQELKLPGMRVMMFGFDGSLHNYHFPDNHEKNCVVYTGTHDNNTARGWITKTAKPKHRRFALKYLKTKPKNFAWQLIKTGMHSPAHTFIAPLQDVLNLNSSARMNKPSTTKNNWNWRFNQKKITKTLTKKLRQLTKSANR